MLRDSLAEQLADTGNGPALGCRTDDPHMVELLAHMGFHWVWFDQMFSSNDWKQIEVLLRAADASGITPVVRIQSSPWLGYDRRVSAEAARAFGIGAKYVMVSPSGKAEIEECLKVAEDWHSPLHIHPFAGASDWARAEQADRSRFVIPQAETEQAIHSYDELIGHEGLRFVFYAMTDASRMLGNSAGPDWYAPDLWDLVDRTVRKANAAGVVVGANTSYAYEMDEMIRRIVKLHKAGVRMIMAQSAYFLFQLGIGGMLKDLAAQLGEQS